MQPILTTHTHAQNKLANMGRSGLFIYSHLHLEQEEEELPKLFVLCKLHNL